MEGIVKNLETIQSMINEILKDNFCKITVDQLEDDDRPYAYLTYDMGLLSFNLRLDDTEPKESLTEEEEDTIEDFEGTLEEWVNSAEYNEFLEEYGITQPGENK